MASLKRKKNQASCRHWWRSRIIAVIISLSFANAQDISACCDKAVGSCRNVCEKMSLVEIGSSSSMREERLQNIYRFCAPELVEFWICMNKTIQEVVSGSDWWGRACCALGRATACRGACAMAKDARALTPMCRRSDELAFFDCVQKQQNAQLCCSQTQSLSCHDACQKVLWRVGHSHIENSEKERAVEACEQSPSLLQCLRGFTVSTVHTDTEKYLPCCRESSSQECRNTCEAVLRSTGESQEIFEGLDKACAKPSLHDEMWQCFLRKDSPVDSKDVIPHDAAKLHCCQKATTINCKRLCFDTYNTGWHTNWQKFYAECLGDPQENLLTQCVDEVEAPCSLGCAGLTYCSHLNDRPTELFRTCSARSDLDAHLAVVEQKDSGFVKISGIKLPLRNSSQCTAEVWKSVACALHVKPCTAKGHSTLLCVEDCTRLVSSCVDWSQVPYTMTAHSLCARITPRDSTAPCVKLSDYVMPSLQPPLLSADEAVTSPCSGSPCNSTQLCIVNKYCETAGSCSKYTCLDGCTLGEDSPIVIPLESWARIPMAGVSHAACYKLCQCTDKGLARCQPLPCVEEDTCRLHDENIPRGTKFFLECNPCACAGERVCGRRACGTSGRLSGRLTRLPCNCPPHYVPVRAVGRGYPNVCLAKCAGASEGTLEYTRRQMCPPSCPFSCLPTWTVCLSRLQTTCPDFVCVNTTNCSAQPHTPVCDSEGRTHYNPCHLLRSGRGFAYWGQCLLRCSQKEEVCGVNGVTYISECAAWSEYVTVDYLGPCSAVGPISDAMEPKCQIDRIICPLLKRPKCLGFTAPGSCCPRCGGALRILYSKKQIDRALYGTNISASVINLKNILRSLERHVKIAECALRGYLTIEMEIFVTVESVLRTPTELQMQLCVLEAEKIADMINRESALISSDLGLSALSYALVVHSYPSIAATSALSIVVLLVSALSVYLM